jgi:hypothetical protein
MLSKEIVQKIKDLCQKYPAIKLLYIFGSQARGDTGPLSDYDFAVYLEESDAQKRFDTKLNLIGALTSILQTNDVDVAVINDTDNINLKYAVISEGKVIYEQDPHRMIVESRILNEYFDFKILIDKYQKIK